MDLINILSFTLFVVFLMSYSLKLLVLKKKAKIDAYVLAKGDKGGAVHFAETAVRIFTFIWGLTWLIESIASDWVDNFINHLFHNVAVGYSGLLVISAGLAFFITAMISMKNSWRVGIDKNTKTQLVTQGVYRYGRNPAFVGFNLMFLGLFLIFPNILTLIICVINTLSIHFLILQEENHLEGMIQKEYLDYKRKTPRYFIF